MADWNARRKEAADMLGSEFGRFQHEFDDLRTRLGRLAGEAARDFGDGPQKLTELRGALDGRLAVIERELDALSRDLRLQGGAVTGRIGHSVREKPLAALAVAAGLGFVAAHLFRRRRAR